MLTYHATKHDGQPSLRLTGVLTIYTVAEARSELPARMTKHGAQVLDLSGIEELDTAGVQLLLWLKRDMAARGSALALTRHSPAVVEVLDQLKLTATFGDPILLSPSAS
jgi:anti-sigma B factor antagonist